MASASPSYLTTFSALRQSRDICLYFRLIFPQRYTGTTKSSRWKVHFFVLINMQSTLELVICLYLKIDENHMHFVFFWWILVWACTICQHGQILIPYIIPSGSPFLPIHAYFCIPWCSSLLDSLIMGWSFFVSHHITFLTSHTFDFIMI